MNTIAAIASLAAGIALVTAAAIAHCEPRAPKPPRPPKPVVCLDYAMVQGGGEAVCNDTARPFVVQEPRSVKLMDPSGVERTVIIGWR